MRPAGDVSMALLRAASELVTPERAPTLREMAHRAQVGESAALTTVKNLTRAGKLKRACNEHGQPRLRQVDYRSAPVAEYEPVSAPLDPDIRQGAGWVDLGRIVGGWAR